MVTLLERHQPLTPEPLNKIDFQAPIGDLGYLLGMNSEAIISTRRPFLVPDRAKSSEIKLLAPFLSGKIICGLAWRSHNKSFGEEKSIGLEQFEPILNSNQFEFINLQYGEVAPELQKMKTQFGIDIHQIDSVDVYNDIDGLLALIDACDLVITTSNLTAHLAGSIGKKGCVLVPVSKGRIWYWHLDDPYSFWYPSLKVLYQGDRYDWTDTIHQAKTWIERDISWNQ
jgi:ADP-heptose:LPS heptosyltransferase